MNSTQTIESSVNTTQTIESVAATKPAIVGQSVPALKLSEDKRKMLEVLAKRPWSNVDTLKQVLLKGAKKNDGTLISFNETEVSIILAEPGQYGLSL